MALRGGYKIIDLKGKPLKPDVGMVYEGIYEQIEETQKPILLSGLVIDNGITELELNDMYLPLEISGSNYVFKIPSGEIKLVITITDNDVVTIKLTQ